MIVIDEAIKYVRDHKTWGEEEDEYAMSQLEYRRKLPHDISDQIHDLMEE